VVDIIIRAKNGRDYLEKLLVSISRHTDPDDYRLIVVDDGSDDPLMPNTGGVVDYVVRSDKSNGAVTATNLGLGVALALEGDYVLIMDNDTEIPEGDGTWLRRFVGELERAGEKTACVGATSDVVNPPQHILTAPDTYTGQWKNDKGRGGSDSQDPAIWFVSFCVLIRKSVIKELGLWDTRYNPGNWEDTDYALQIRKAGYEIRVAQSVYVRHKGHATFSDDLKTLMKVNQEKFAEKWGVGCLWDMGLIPDREVAIMSGRRAGILKETA
jgi:GT2 family glycosyltransferase